MGGKFGIIKILIRSSLDNQLMNSIGKVSFNVNVKVKIFNSIIQNILGNFILHVLLSLLEKAILKNITLKGQY